MMNASEQARLSGDTSEFPQRNRERNNSQEKAATPFNQETFLNGD